MKLLFKQRVFSWFDSYDIYDEQGNSVLTVKSQFKAGHCLKILDTAGREVGAVKEPALTFQPRFELYAGDRRIGGIRKKVTFFKPKFVLDMNGWTVEGNWLEWDYSIRDSGGHTVATISKQLFNWSDTYVIDVLDPADAIPALMVVLAIDAEKSSRN
ncbi:MAG: LURP-one-related/scramblase family protein [Candidatus Faecivicinus sp.]